MNDIINLREFKTDIEKSDFIAAQHRTIVDLLKNKSHLEQEIQHLKELLINSVEDSKVERIIVTPEEALIGKQIDLLKQKGILEELDLEDVKKLDLLLKNKHIIKVQQDALRASSKKVTYSNSDLLSIVKALPEPPKQ